MGAHVPVAGGLARTALAYADEIGAEAVQVFVSNPRGWAPAAGDARQDEAFRSGCADRGVPAFVHSPYLINFGSPTEATLLKSSAALTHSLRRAAAIGARGVVVHAGSSVYGDRRADALRQVREQLLPILDAIGDGGPRLLIEPTAGGGQPLAARVPDLAEYFDNLDHHPALGVCLDICHAFAAGHDFTRAGEVRATISALTRACGRCRLELIHANDSMDPAGSGRDRHARVGAGLVGERAFAEFLAMPSLATVPFVVETAPGDHGSDMAILKRLRRR